MQMAQPRPADQLRMVDTVNRRLGTTEEWVERFASLWARGAECRDDFTSLLSRRVRLVAPGLAPTEGWEEGQRAFSRAFDALPDLTAEVRSWAVRDDILFLELRFSATIGGKAIEWPAVDRFRFEKGEAVERVSHFDRTQIRKTYLSSIGGLIQLWRMRRIREKN